MLRPRYESATLSFPWHSLRMVEWLNRHGSLPPLSITVSRERERELGEGGGGGLPSESIHTTEATCCVCLRLYRGEIKDEEGSEKRAIFSTQIGDIFLLFLAPLPTQEIYCVCVSSLKIKITCITHNNWQKKVV